MSDDATCVNCPVNENCGRWDDDSNPECPARTRERLLSEVLGKAVFVMKRVKDGRLLPEELGPYIKDMHRVVTGQAITKTDKNWLGLSKEQSEDVYKFAMKRSGEIQKGYTDKPESGNEEPQPDTVYMILCTGCKILWTQESVSWDENKQVKRCRGCNSDKLKTVELTGTRCSRCGTYQFNTPNGVSCSQGHGGAPSKEDVFAKISADAHKSVRRLSQQYDKDEIE